MKSKDLKILRKKLAKANKVDRNLLEGVPKEDLAINIIPTDQAESKPNVLGVNFTPSSSLTESQFKACLDLFEVNMGDMYRGSSWGLDMEEKKSELKHPNARFLLVTDQQEKLAAFVHFRFEYDWEESPTQGILYVYEIQIQESYRRHGLGKKLMGICDIIASVNEMEKIVLTVFKNNKQAMDFYGKLGYDVDESSPSQGNESADYEILSRPVTYKQ